MDLRSLDVDRRRIRYLAAVLERMRADPAEEARIRRRARDLIAMKRHRALAGEAFLRSREAFLDLPLG